MLQDLTKKLKVFQISVRVEYDFSETFNYHDLLTLKSENAIKTAGKMRIEGQNYLVQDGDIVHIRFNV